MKNILLTALIVCIFMAGCKGKTENKETETAIQQNGIVEFDKRFWRNAIGTSVWLTTYHEERAQQFPSVVEYVDPNLNSDYEQRIIIATNGSSLLVGFISVQLEYNDAKEEFVLVVREEHCYQYITPESPLVVNLTFPGLMPTRGLIVEENNTKRYFTINDNSSGLEDSAPLIISEYTEVYHQGSLEGFDQFFFFGDTIIPWTAYRISENGMSIFDSIGLIYENNVHELKPAGYDLRLSGYYVDFSSYISCEDYNFDGFIDIGFDNSHESGSLNPKSLIYLYNPQTNFWEFNEILSAISNLSIDTDKKIVSDHHIGAQGSYATRHFKWENNQFTLVYHETMEYDNESEIYTKTTNTLKNNGKWEEKIEKLTFEELTKEDEH